MATRLKSLEIKVKPNIHKTMTLLNSNIKIVAFLLLDLKKMIELFKILQKV